MRVNNAFCNTRGGHIENSKFCVLPWVHLFTNQLGEFFPCCWSESAGRAFRDEKNKKININQKNSIQRALESKDLQKLKSDMLNGIENDYCQRCYNQEKHGLGSYRQVYNRHYDGLYEKLNRSPSEEENLTGGLRFLDLRVGNQCNLKCRMCKPEASKLLLPEWERLYGAFSSEKKKELLSLNWFDSPTLWNDLLEHAPHLEKLHFAGGEPFIMKSVIAFLKLCVERGHSSNISLSFNTNVTVLPDEMLSLWPRFKQVDVVCSVDAFGELNDFIRHPSKWRVISKNLKYLNDHKKELNCSNLDMNTTVQIYNIFNLDELILYNLNELPAFHPYPFFALLHWPSHLSVQVLDKAHKLKAEKKLIRFLNKIKKTHPQIYELGLKNEIEGIIQFMNAHEASHLKLIFQIKNKVTDVLRSQKTSKNIPHLKNFLF